MSHHVVRRGETLSVIAHRYRTTVRVIARLNGIDDPNRVSIGLRLIVPGLRDPAPTATPIAVQPPRSRSGVRTQTEAPAPPAVTPAQPDDITEAQIQAIMPSSGDRAATFVAPLNAAMRAHGIDTVERRAAFLAQISVESGQLRSTVENMNYTTVAGLRRTWPTRFPTDESARPYVRNPEALANHVYANRRDLGNGDTASGDGWRYRGRGLMQVTGRNNYRAAGFENNPEALAEPETAADSAAGFWEDNDLNGRTGRELDRQAFDRVSRRVNGGGHGINERWQAYQRALTALRPAPSQ